jgi:hypothetical protein
MAARTAQDDKGVTDMAPPISDTSEDIGPRGLVIFGKPGSAPNTFNFVNESTWRKTAQSYDVQAQTGDFKSLSTLNVALARLGASVFVDLDQLKQLALTTEALAAQQQPATQAGPIPSLGGANVILKELGKLYVVPEEIWSTANAAISGDAGVLINRDAVLAPIPKNPIAEGTFCVLINLAALA